MPRMSRPRSPAAQPRGLARAPWARLLPLLAFLPAVLAACETTTGTHPGEVALLAVGAPTRAGVVGAPVEPPVSVRLTRGGRPVRGVAVSWSTPDASMPDGGRSKTDADGVAAMGWTLGTTPGEYALTAAAAGVGEVAFSASAVAGPFARLRITPRIASLPDVGDTAVLGALATDRYGNRVTMPALQWRTLHPLVASVSATGVVRGLTGGSASIVASAGTAADTVTVVVQQQPASVALVTRSAMLRALGATVTLVAIVRDRFGNPIPGALAGWSSLDTAVARVDGHGAVTAVRNGVARIRAAAGMNADTAQVTVAQEPVRMYFQPASLGVIAGDSVGILPLAWDSLGSLIDNPVLTWVSTDSTIARVLRPGWTQGRRAGTTTVRVYRGAVTAALTLTVRAGAVVSATISPTATNLRIGQSLSFTVTFLDAFGNAVPGIAASWISSDPTRLQVAADGTATGKALGVVNLTGSGAGVGATAVVTVVDW